ncbi:MAG: ATP synthase F1 subunit gamma [Planctomycetota bacterium]
MANLRDLRQRITSVGNIQKITRAMEMVATTKLRRFQSRAVAAKPYASEIHSLVDRLAGTLAEDLGSLGKTARLFRPGRADAPHGILFVGSDRGLCGAYNANVQRILDESIRELGRPVRLFVMGRKAMAHAARAELEVAAFFEDRPLEKLAFGDAAAISGLLVKEFKNGALSGVSLCYTSFVSMMRYKPCFEPFLPFPAPERDRRDSGQILFEPDAPSLVGELVSRFLETSVFHAFLESITSEYASRRIAMKNATDAAGDMKTEITRSYNQARQQKITSEILEVVAGKEAL